MIAKIVTKTAYVKTAEIMYYNGGVTIEKLLTIFATDAVFATAPMAPVMPQQTQRMTPKATRRG